MVTAVITGASSGLGKEYINAIIAEYPTVDVFWLVARRKELLKEIADEHPDKTIAAISLDLSQQESLEIFEKLLKENEPEIKVLVNNAGFGKCGDFFTSNRASQMGMVDVNCRALTAITRLCLPYMLDDSLVINVASIAGLDGDSRLDYSASKAAVIAATKKMARELVSVGIRVNAPAPGLTDTDLVRELSDKVKQAQLDRILLHRMARPEEIANVAAFLASDLASYVTGQVWRVDGGML